MDLNYMQWWIFMNLIILLIRSGPNLDHPVCLVHDGDSWGRSSAYHLKGEISSLGQLSQPNSESTKGSKLEGDNSTWPILESVPRSGENRNGVNTSDRPVSKFRVSDWWWRRWPYREWKNNIARRFLFPYRWTI